MFSLQEFIDFALGCGTLFYGCGVSGTGGDEGVTGGLEAGFLSGDGGFEGFDAGVAGEGIQMLGRVEERALEVVHQMGEAVGEGGAERFCVGREGGRVLGGFGIIR